MSGAELHPLKMDVLAEAHMRHPDGSSSRSPPTAVTPQYAAAAGDQLAGVVPGPCPRGRLTAVLPASSKPVGWAVPSGRSWDNPGGQHRQQAAPASSGISV